MKILIAIPTFENIAPQTFKSIYDLYSGGHDISFEYITGYDCAKARNMIGRKTVEDHYDAVLTVDSDMEIPKDALISLISADVPVAMGWYLRRIKGGPSDGRTSLHMENFSKAMSVDEVASHDKPFKVLGGGFGCVLVKRDVFMQVEYPWFVYENRGNGSFKSEDFVFCSACHDNGIDIVAVPSVRCGHVMKYVQYPEVK